MSDFSDATPSSSASRALSETVPDGGPSRSFLMLQRRDFMRLSSASAALFAPMARAESNASAASDRARKWEAFTDGLKDVGKKFLEAHDTGDPVTEAEGLRYLVRLLGRSIEDEMMSAEAQPMMRLNTSDISKAGLDAAECKYTYSAIDSAGTYRVWGKVGTAQYISFQLYGYPTVSATGGQDQMTTGAAINHLGLKPGPDGSFEVMIGAQLPQGWSGPWLKLAASDNILFGREYFNDW